MDLLHEICKEFGLKHTGIKQNPYSAPVLDTYANHFEQDISQLQTDIQILKEFINTLHSQYAAPFETNPVAFQQQLSKMKEDIKHLQQTEGPNVYITPPRNYRFFRSTHVLVICRRCNRVGHFVRTCPANLQPSRAPTCYQHYRHNYIPPRPHIFHDRQASLINILNVLPVNQMPIDTVLWDILCGDQHFHLTNKPTTSTKREDLIFQVNKKL